MKTLSIRDMRKNLGRLDRLVTDSGELLVTRRGRAIARILPVEGAKPKPDHADLRQQMRWLDTPSETLIAVERDER